MSGSLMMAHFSSEPAEAPALASRAAKRPARIATASVKPTPKMMAVRLRLRPQPESSPLSSPCGELESGGERSGAGGCGLGGE
eukprot:6180364-Pleurochrysis_carterae.AAC.2